MDEFCFISRLLAPLAEGENGALGLKDDAAILRVPRGFELVVTKDALLEGVHFVGNEPPRLIARKLLRVNLSDLAAMGATPWGYFLALMLPAATNDAWLKDFAAGLYADQKEYAIKLMGGDTTRTSGTLTLTLTALGLVPMGKALRRNGANVGDSIWVSGTIGDAALGLGSTKNGYLRRRYQLPQPRVTLGQSLRGIASACMDISDGLAQDLGHICEASGVGAQVKWSQIPLSTGARLALKKLRSPYEIVLAGGDDYELLFTVPTNGEKRLRIAARKCQTLVTQIGHITARGAVRILNGDCEEIKLGRKGFRHF